VIPQRYPLWAVFESLAQHEGLVIPAFCLVIGWHEPKIDPVVWRPVMIDLADRDPTGTVVGVQDERLIHYFTDYDEAVGLREILTRGGGE
jgi:hypothetical protein